MLAQVQPATCDLEALGMPPIVLPSQAGWRLACTKGEDG